MMPFGVETMAIPRPLSTFGISFVTRIAAQARTAHPLQSLDCIDLGLGVVLEGYLDGSMPPLVFPEFVRKDIPLIVQNLGNFLLNF